MNVSMSRTAVAVLLMVSGAAMTQPYGISVSTSGRDSGLGDKANSPSVSEQPMQSRIRRLICSSLRQRRPVPGCSIFAQRVGAEQVRGKLGCIGMQHR
jgi:hypothetical protein